MNETARDALPTADEFERTLSAVCEAAVTLAKGKYDNVEHSGMVIFDDPHSGTVRAEYPREVKAVGTTIKLDGIAPEEALVANAEPIVVRDVEADDSLGPVKKILLQLGVKSIVIVPVIVDGRVKGSFSFDALSAKHEFTPDEVEYCRAFAHFASYVIQNAYLLNEKRMQAHNLEALREAMLAITAQHEREPLLRAVIEQAVRLLNAAGGGIYEYDSRREVLEVIFDSNRPSNIGKTLKASKDSYEGMAGRVLMEGHPYLETDDYGQWVGRADIYKRDVPFGSVIEVPLIWQKERRGVLYVDREKGRRFKPEDAELLERFAAAASIALQHGKLAERDQYMLGRLERLAAATNDIIGSLNAETSGETGRLRANFPDDQLTLIARLAREILSAEACGIHQVKEPGWLTLVASDGHRKGGFRKNRKFQIKSEPGGGLTGHIASRMEVFSKCGDELIKHEAVADATTNETRTPFCYSLLAVPLLKKTADGEQVCGLIKVSNKKGKDGLAHPGVCFTEDDEFIATIFAQAATVVIETAELFAQKTRARDRFENLLEAVSTITRAESYEAGLQSLAQKLVTLLGKSFCRILLVDESERYLLVSAAAKMPCARDEFEWTPNIDKTTRIDKWGDHLKKAFDTKKPKVLGIGKPSEAETLNKLSGPEWLNLRSKLTGEPLVVQSLLTIPLKLGNKRIGLLNVGELRGCAEPAQPRTNERPLLQRKEEKVGFSEDEKELAAAVADQATQLIDKMMREKEINRRRELYEKLDEAITRIRTQSDRQQIYDSMVREAATIFSGVAGVVIESVDRSELEILDSMEGRRAHAAPKLADMPGLVNKNVVVDPPHGPSKLADLPGFLGRIARGELSVPGGPPAIAYDFRDRKGEAQFLEQHGFTTLLAARVQVDPAIRFIIYVGDTSEGTKLGRADLEVLRRLGHQCAISLAKALSREQLSRTRDVAQIVAGAVATGDLQWTLRKVVEGIMNSIGCDAVSLHRRDRENKSFIVPPSMAGVTDEASAQRLQSVDKGSPPQKIHDASDRELEDDMHFALDSPDDSLIRGGFVRREGIVSSAAVRLRAQGEKIGVMFVNYRSKHVFSEEDKKNIKLFADQAAVAIRLARLYDENRAFRRTQNKISDQLNRDYKHARGTAWIHMVISLSLAVLFATPIAISVYHLHSGEASNRAGAFTMLFILLGSLGAEVTNYIFAQKAEGLYERADKFHSELLQAGRFEQLLTLCDEMEDGAEKKRLKAALLDSALSHWIGASETQGRHELAEIHRGRRQT